MQGRVSYASCSMNKCSWNHYAMVQTAYDNCGYGNCTYITRKGLTCPCQKYKIEMQEFLEINAPILKHIRALGADCASPSDACRAWLEIQDHFVQLTAKSLFRLSVSPQADLIQLQQQCAARVRYGLNDAHYLALLLDPRPGARAFVQKHKLAGSRENNTLGQSPALDAAKKELQAMAPAVTVNGKTPAEVGKALFTALTVFLQVTLWKASAFVSLF
jgi:hypothetical protein